MYLLLALLLGIPLGLAVAVCLGLPGSALLALAAAASLRPWR